MTNGLFIIFFFFFLQAVNLLTASMVSTSVLTNGLKDSMRSKLTTEKLVKAKVEK